jgi:hypothetical protein
MVAARGRAQLCSRSTVELAPVNDADANICTSAGDGEQMRCRISRGLRHLPTPVATVIELART